MSHGWIRLLATILLIVAVLLVIRLHRAEGATLPEAVTAGHRLAVNWCKECHAVERNDVLSGKGPAFVRIANMPSTTELSLKVFLRSNHSDMPNLVIAPSEADEIVRYILSLKRD
ncbi:c-type cytochrome [Rhodopseudomonas palustris]|nr:cytochrome c [Rhodopseudomonas palustris]